MPSLAEQMAADALDAMKLSRKYFVVELDYSITSLEKFEDMFSQWHFAMPGGNKPENVERLVRVWGAYLGEVVRRSSGGQWNGELDQPESIAFEAGTRLLHPHDIIRRRLSGETKPGLGEVIKDESGRKKAE